jgi:hypothetical protein
VYLVNIDYQSHQCNSNILQDRPVYSVILSSKLYKMLNLWYIHELFTVLWIYFLYVYLLFMYVILCYYALICCIMFLFKCLYFGVGIEFWSARFCNILVPDRIPFSEIIWQTLRKFTTIHSKLILHFSPWMIYYSEILWWE